MTNSLPPTGGLSGAVVRFRGPLLAAFLAVTAAFGYQLRGLELDGSMERINMKSDPARMDHERSVELFGDDDLISVLIHCADGLWNEEALRRVDRVTRAIVEIDGVAHATSVTTHEIPLRDGSGGTITIPEMIARGLPLDGLEQLGESDPVVRRNLASEDGRTAAINIRPQSIADGPIGFEEALASDIRATLAREVGVHGYYIAGWPIIQADVSSSMKRDLKVLLPGVAVVVALLLAVSFRRLAGIVLPMAAIGAAIVWTMGGMIAMGDTMSLITNSLPVIIVAIGSTYCVHMMANVLRAFDAGADTATAVCDTLRHTGRGIVLSAFTTVVGFGALMFNPVESIREFGTLAMWGVVASVVAALVFVPAAAMLWPLRRRDSAASASAFGAGVGSDALVAGVLAHRGLVWMATLAMIGVGVFGISKIRIETAPLSWFADDSPIAESVAYTNEHLAGVTPFNVVFETGRNGGAYEPALLARVEEFESWLADQPEVDATLSFVDLVKAAAYERNDVRQLPATQRDLEDVIDTVRKRDPSRLATLITPDGAALNLVLRSPVTASEPGVAFGRRVTAKLNSDFADFASATLTGSSYLTYRSNLHFTGGLVTSLSIGALVISLTMVLVFRSWKLGLLSMIPNLIPILVNYSVLGLPGFTLNMATSITGCIAIGMAVDDTIHFVIAFRENLRRSGDRFLAVGGAMREVGKPMLVTTVSLCLGFAVLLASEFKPVATLGLQMMVTMAACLLCDAVLLPVLLTSRVPKFAPITWVRDNWRAQSIPTIARAES